MNVIISQDKSVRVMQTKNSAYNIQEITIYVSKGLEEKPVYLLLKKYRNMYPFETSECPTDARNYRTYKVIFTQPVSLTQREYDIAVKLGDEEISVGSYELQQIRRR